MTKCAQVGHGFRMEKDLGNDSKLERCIDCGFSAVFRSSNWAEDQEYMKSHRRDFIQPDDREAWNIAYPQKKIVDDPKRKDEMRQMLHEKLGSKHLPLIAEEYFRTYGGQDDMANILKWHFGL